jgi:hypothetical protein
MDALEIQVEDVGGTALVFSLLMTLGTQHGVACRQGSALVLRPLYPPWP